MAEKEYSLDSLPEDLTVDTSETSAKEYDPLPQDVYQVEILDIKLVDNFWYKPEEKYSNKYQLEFSFVVIEEGEHYGRRLWRKCSPSLKPQGKRGATIMYKIVTSALGSEMDWDSCEGFSANLSKNLKDLVGRQLRVTVEQYTSQAGNTGNKVTAYMPVKKELPKFEPKEESAKSSDDIDIDELLSEL